MLRDEYTLLVEHSQAQSLASPQYLKYFLDKLFYQSLRLFKTGLGVELVVKIDVERNFERFDLHSNLLLALLKEVFLLVDLFRRRIEVQRLRC